jgi:hypothetical protein
MKTKSVIPALLLMVVLTGCGRNSEGNNYGGAGAPSEGPSDKKADGSKETGNRGGSWGP